MSLEVVDVQLTEEEIIKQAFAQESLIVSGDYNMYVVHKRITVSNRYMLVFTSIDEEHIKICEYFYDNQKRKWRVRIDRDSPYFQEVFSILELMTKERPSINVLIERR